MTTLIPKFDLKNGGLTPTLAVNRPIYDKLAEVVSIKDLGAVGDGVTDDTAAIQAAINLNFIQYTPLYFPEGTYLVNGQLTFFSDKFPPDYVPSLRMYGEGISNITNPDVQPDTGGTVIKTTATSGTLFTATGNQAGLCFIDIENIQFVGPDRMDATGPVTTVNGLVFTSTVGIGCSLRINNVTVSGFGGTGVRFQNVENSLISALTVNYCNIGILNTGATNANVFNYLEVQENFTAGLKIESGIGNSYLTPLIQGNKKTGLWMQGAESTSFVAPYFEGNNYTLDSNSYSIYIRNPGDGVTLVNNVSFYNAIVNSNATGTNAGVYIDASGGNAYTIDSLNFIACRCRQNTTPNMTIVGPYIANSTVDGGFSLSLTGGATVTTNNWINWTPTIGNATANAGATSKFKYRQRGNLIELYVELDNYNVTSNGEITVSPPTFLNYYGPLYCIDRRSGTNIFANYDANTQQIKIAKSFGVNWTAGDTTGAIIQGSYPLLFT